MASLSEAKGSLLHPLQQRQGDKDEDEDSLPSWRSSRRDMLLLLLGGGQAALMASPNVPGGIPSLPLPCLTDAKIDDACVRVEK